MNSAIKTRSVRKKDVSFMEAKFRVIKDSIFDPVKHYALEEAMMRLMDEDPSFPNTLRLRRVKRSVLVGFLENPEDTVNLDFAKKNGVKIVRRHSLGGTVYQDLGSFMFTILFREGTFISNLSEREMYAEFSKFVIEFLKRFGVDGKIRGINDIVVNDKKIFGSAHTKLGNAISHTGTILVNMDLDFLSKVLKFVKPKFSDKKFTSLKDALTTLSLEVGREVKIEEAYDKFLDTFREYFNVKLIEGNLSEREIRLMEKLSDEKYKRYEWTFGEGKDYEEIYTKKVKSGLIVIRGRFKERIEEIRIYGDFLLEDRNLIPHLEMELKGLTFKQAIDKISRKEIPIDIKIGLIEIMKEIEKEHMI